MLLGVGHKLGQRSVDGILVVVLHNDARHLDARGRSQVDELLGGLNLLFAGRDVNRGIEHRDGEALVAQGASRGLGVVAVKGAALTRKSSVNQGIVDFDAREVHLEGSAYQLIPGVVGPTAGGKGKLH